MCKLFQFPGFYGTLVGLLLLAVTWLSAWLKLKPLKEGESYQFDTPGEKGSFAPLLASYLDLAKFVLGLASGTIVLLVGSATFREGGARNLLASFASPLFLLALSILYGVLFRALIIFDYEGYRHKTQLYTRLKYSRNLALGCASRA